MNERKAEELEELDELVRIRMIDILKTKNDPRATDALTSLTPAINYLKANQVIQERKMDNVEEETKKRLEDAKKRRGEL